MEPGRCNARDHGQCGTAKRNRREGVHEAGDSSATKLRIGLHCGRNASEQEQRQRPQPTTRAEDVKRVRRDGDCPPRGHGSRVSRQRCGERQQQGAKRGERPGQKRTMGKLRRLPEKSPFRLGAEGKDEANSGDHDAGKLHQPTASPHRLRDHVHGSAGVPHVRGAMHRIRLREEPAHQRDQERTDGDQSDPRGVSARRLNQRGWRVCRSLQ